VRPYGLGRTAWMELRLSPEEKAAFATMAAARGESVGEYVRDAAAHHLAYDEVMMRERTQELRVRRLDQPRAKHTASIDPQDVLTRIERAKESMDAGQKLRERARLWLRRGDESSA